MKEFLKALGILSDEEISGLAHVVQQRSLEKGELFIREGEVCNEVAFVQSGLLRSFYTNEEGEEFTYCLSFPNNFMNAYSSFITGEPTVENIQAVQSTDLLVFKKSDVHNHFADSPNWVVFQKAIAENQYLALEKRLFSHQRDDATKRYLQLIEDYPEYVREVPLQYLASYLGISQRHLSRIRREIVY